MGFFKPKHNIYKYFRVLPLTFPYVHKKIPLNKNKNQTNNKKHKTNKQNVLIHNPV